MALTRSRENDLAHSLLTRLNPSTQLGTQNKDFGKRVSLLYLLFVHSHYLQRIIFCHVYNGLLGSTLCKKGDALYQEPWLYQL